MKNLPGWFVVYVVDPAERAARTFAQQLFVVLLAGGTAGALVTQNWLLAVDSAGLAALVSVLTSILTFKVPALPAAADLALRVGKTAVQSFLGTIAAGNILDVSHVDWKASLAVAYTAAFAALVTGLAALGVSGTNGASLVPAGLGTAQAVEGQDEVDPARLDSLSVSDDPAETGKHRA